MAGTDLEMGSTTSAEGPLDVSGPVRGEIVVSLSAAFGRHGCVRGRTGRVERAGGGGCGRGTRRIKVIADAEE